MGSLPMGELSSADSAQQEQNSLELKMLQPLLVTSYVAGMVAASCSYSSPDPKARAKDDKTYQADCISALESQVKIEFSASLQYLLMAAHFSQDTVNLPKVSDLFWTHADEERDHAIQFITYLRMRGATNTIFLNESPHISKQEYFTLGGSGRGSGDGTRHGEGSDREDEGYD